MWIKINDDLYNLDHVMQISIDKNKDNPFAKYYMLLYHNKESLKTGSVTKIEFLKEKDMLLAYEDILSSTGCVVFQRPFNDEDKKKFDEWQEMKKNYDMADEVQRDEEEYEMRAYDEYKQMNNKNVTATYDLGKGKN